MSNTSVYLTNLFFNQPRQKRQLMFWLTIFKEEPAVHGGHEERFNIVLRKTADYNMLEAQKIFGFGIISKMIEFNKKSEKML